MSLKNIMVSILPKLKIPLISMISFVLLLSIKRNLYPGIIFFEGILILILVALILFRYHVLKENNIVVRKENIYLIIISFLFILTFHTTIITIVDRSISIFILNEIKNHNSNEELIKEKFIQDFSYKSINKRISEQENMGNIFIVDNKIYLSNKGKVYYHIFYFLNFIFNTDNLILNNQHPTN